MQKSKTFWAWKFQNKEGTKTCPCVSRRKFSKTCPRENQRIPADDAKWRRWKRVDFSFRLILMIDAMIIAHLNETLSRYKTHY